MKKVVFGFILTMSLLYQVFGFAYFGLLIATLKLKYANLLSMWIQTIG